MEDNRVELKELKNNIVRCIIPYKDVEGNDKQIEVYNIIGERRKQILGKLEEIVQVEEGQEEIAIHDYYMELISEFSDVELDETDINEILLNPTLEFQILRKEIDDMIYELQYELICEQIKINRALIINGMNQQSLKEFKAHEDFIESSDKMIMEFKGDE